MGYSLVFISSFTHRLEVHICKLLLFECCVQVQIIQCSSVKRWEIMSLEVLQFSKLMQGIIALTKVLRGAHVTLFTFALYDNTPPKKRHNHEIYPHQTLNLLVL